MEIANVSDALLKKISKGKIYTKSLRNDVRKNVFADSLPPVPSADHAKVLGIQLGRDTTEKPKWRFPI